jgi:uncharacterized membrane protein YdjX (TVP38/TMEM64 family)
MVLVFLVSFGFVETMEWQLLTDPTPWMSGNMAGAALLGIGLLTADIFIPVPATIVMITHGALFGVPLGTLISIIGSLLAAWLGFALGRYSEPWIARWVPEAERQRANQTLTRYGLLAVIVTRPVPILSESIAIMAGSSKLSWPSYSLAVVAGSIPAAFLYAFTGATAANFDSMVLIFGLVLLIAGVFWLMGRFVVREE